MVCLEGWEEKGYKVLSHLSLWDICWSCRESLCVPAGRELSCLGGTGGNPRRSALERVASRFPAVWDEPEEQQGHHVSQQVCLLSHGCVQALSCRKQSPFPVFSHPAFHGKARANITTDTVKVQRPVAPWGEISMLTCSGSQGRCILLLWTKDDIWS